MIAIGSDHAGFALKEHIRAYLEEKGIPYTDFGTDSTQSVDYPIYAARVAKAVAGGQAQQGMLFCGTGIGVSIMANRFTGIRAALCTDEFMARMCRAHNDANILVMGGAVVGQGLARSIVDVFLATEFDGGRHAKRIAMFEDESIR